MKCLTPKLVVLKPDGFEKGGFRPPKPPLAVPLLTPKLVVCKPDGFEKGGGFDPQKPPLVAPLARELYSSYVSEITSLKLGDCSASASVAFENYGNA